MIAKLLDVVVEAEATAAVVVAATRSVVRSTVARADVTTHLRQERRKVQAVATGAPRKMRLRKVSPKSPAPLVVTMVML